MLRAAAWTVGRGTHDGQGVERGGAGLSGRGPLRRAGHRLAGRRAAADGDVVYPGWRRDRVQHQAGPPQGQEPGPRSPGVLMYRRRLSLCHHPRTGHDRRRPGDRASRHPADRDPLLGARKRGRAGGEPIQQGGTDQLSGEVGSGAGLRIRRMSGVVALAGGVGGAKLAQGLYQVLPPDALTMLVNTADDFTLHGLRICPDLDTVLYTLAGRANAQTGWGLAGDTFATLAMLTRY